MTSSKAEVYLFWAHVAHDEFDPLTFQFGRTRGLLGSFKDWKDRKMTWFLSPLKVSLSPFAPPLLGMETPRAPIWGLIGDLRMPTHVKVHLGVNMEATFKSNDGHEYQWVQFARAISNNPDWDVSRPWRPDRGSRPSKQTVTLEDGPGHYPGEPIQIQFLRTPVGGRPWNAGGWFPGWGARFPHTPDNILDTELFRRLGDPWIIHGQFQTYLVRLDRDKKDPAKVTSVPVGSYRWGYTLTIEQDRYRIRPDVPQWVDGIDPSVWGKVKVK